MTARRPSVADGDGEGSGYRWLLLAGIWTMYFCFGLVGASMAPIVLEIRTDLGITNAMMGAILGTWQFVYIGAAIPCGMLLDRFQPRLTLLLGSLFVALSALMRGHADDTFTMFLAVALFGIGGPLISVGAPKLSAQWFTGSQRGLAVGIYTTAPALGGAAALALTTSVLMPLTDGDWRGVMFIYAAISLAAGLAWFVIAGHRLARRAHPPSKTRPEFDPRGVVALLAIPAVPLILLMAVGIFFVNHGLNSWLPEILRSKGLSQAQAGSWASVTMVAGIVGSLVVPRLAAPGRRLLVLGLVFATMTLSALLLFLPAGPGLIAPLILIGIARTCATAVLMLLLIELPGIGNRNHGLAAGMFFVAGEIGGMLGPLTIGVTAHASGGFDISLWVIAGLSALLVLLARFLARGGKETPGALQRFAAHHRDTTGKHAGKDEPGC